MAVVILGGLFTSTVLNLFLLPAIFLRYGGASDLDNTVKTTGGTK
jgi:Cu/Ag efflux pump CusA